MDNQSNPQQLPDEKDEMMRVADEAAEVHDALLRKDVLEDFWSFSKEVIGWKDLYEPLHKPLCYFVQNNPNKKKLILLPRGHLKSSVITIGYALWRIAQNPKIRILIANGTYPLAATFLSQIKDHIMRNERFRKLFGDLYSSSDKWSESAITVKREESYEKKEATVTAFGIGGNLVSQHYDLVLLDDLVNRENIHTQERISDVLTFYKDVLDLLEPVTGELLMTGTRWHEADLYGWILDPENPEHHEFEIMEKKAIEGEFEIVRNPDTNGFTIEGGEVLFPTKFTREHLSKLLNKGVAEFCTPKETPILLSDFTTKSISQIKAGEEVIGFTIGKYGGSGIRIKSKLVKAKVKSVYKYKNRPIITLVMKSGRIVRCTKEHKWYTARQDKTHRLYAPAKIGRKLMYVFEEENSLSAEEKILWSYLAGMFDGEGSAKTGGLTITQGMGYNREIYERIKKTFKNLSIPFGEYIKAGEFRDVSMMWMNNSFVNAIRLIRYGNPAKKFQIANWLLRRGSNFIKERDEIVDIIENEAEDVYALETETGNYIAWGYASSNSAQYLNDPVPQSDAIFKWDWKYYEEDDLRGIEVRHFITCDPAFFDAASKIADLDYTAFVVVAVDSENYWWIRDIVRERMTPNQIIETMFRLDAFWKPTRLGIESVSFQKILSYMARQQMRERNQFIPITELKHAGANAKSKGERIQALEPRYANGTIYHPKTVKHITTLEFELRRFPRARTDDIADALASMLEIATPPAKRDVRTHRHGPVYPA